MVSFDGIYRVETPLVPKEALREAVLNAIAHRDYSNSAPIQIRVYENRIALYNPGRLPLGWTVETLLDTHESVPHNPSIVNAFFRAGMIEAWGSGIGKIISACQTSGTATPRWLVKPGGLSLEFVATDVIHGYSVHSGYADKGRDTLQQPES